MLSILKDEGGQIVLTERLDLAVIAAVTLIIVVALLIKLDNVSQLVGIVIAGFIGFLGRGIAQNGLSEILPSTATVTAVTTDGSEESETTDAETPNSQQGA